MEHNSGTISRAPRWQSMADRVLQGGRISADEGLAVLASPDEDLLDLLAAVWRVRYRRHGNRVHLNFLINAKSGLCGEDCGYCAQSRVSTAEIARHPLLDPEDLLAGARVAAQRRARTYCIVISGRGPAEADLDAIARSVPRIKAEFDLHVCVSPGLLTAAQAARLKGCGVDRVNHNLNTSRRFYGRICGTHSYQDRLDTLRQVRAAGLEICSGGIVGMGEDDADVVELALRLGELRAEAVPVNFYIPIPGTPLAVGQASSLPSLGATGGQAGSLSYGRLTPRYCLKVLALFRLANPDCELRIAAGRELHLRGLQPLGLYAADSIFVGDYLTTKGQPPDEDYRMLEDLGFEPVLDGAGHAGRSREPSGTS